MDFLSRLIGSYAAPKQNPPRPVANDPRARLGRFRRVFATVLDLCNRPRNIAHEGPLLANLSTCVEKIAALLREESRAPVSDHACLAFAANNQIYAVIARAASASQNEPVIRATIAVFAALVDSEEEDFLASAPFAKTLMRLVTKVVDAGNVLLRIDTETAILELLFTIAAKIRLQPDILPVWFQSSGRANPGHRPDADTLKFVGITQKNDFPLCYLLIDRVHHEGRIGDFARTGLLYVFEVTGRSPALEEWVVTSDLPTLMASGLGALYSQLNRELSILHPDATLPAVLAMSDYSTTHLRPSAESAFSDRHKAHMATFLSYLAFWQDVLDHCRSTEVKQTLLDHFQILFLQQLLYPSILQSSDTDAGSAVAVLTYMCAMLESLDDTLIHNMLIYLLAIQDEQATSEDTTLSVDPPPTESQTTAAVRRRQSLMLLNNPSKGLDAVEPVLFNLVDLIINNIASNNSQTVYSALQLASTLIMRQKKYCFGTLLTVHKARSSKANRVNESLTQELDHFLQIAIALHPPSALDTMYAALCDDVRLVIEAQLRTKPVRKASPAQEADDVGVYVLPSEDPLLQASCNLLRTFFTNSVDVNLALTQTLFAMAVCTSVRLEGWLTCSPPTAIPPTAETPPRERSWQAYLEDDEREAWHSWELGNLPSSNSSPPESSTPSPLPPLQTMLHTLQREVEQIRTAIPNLDALVTTRQGMLQLTGRNEAPDFPVLPSDSQSSASAEHQPTGHSRNPSASSRLAAPGGSVRSDMADRPSLPMRPATATAAPSPSPPSPNPDRAPANYSVFRPPPPDSPSTTDILMQTLRFPTRENDTVQVSPFRPGDTVRASPASDPPAPTLDSDLRSATLNHVLTNIVILDEFVLELTAVIQVRAALLPESFAS